MVLLFSFCYTDIQRWLYTFSIRPITFFCLAMSPLFRTVKKYRFKLLIRTELLKFNLNKFESPWNEKKFVECVLAFSLRSRLESFPRPERKRADIRSQLSTCSSTMSSPTMPSCCCCLRRVCEPRSKSFSKFQACSGVLMEMTHRRGCLTQILTQKRRTAKGGFKRFVRRPVFFRPVVKMNHPDEIKLTADACVNCVTLTGHDSNERGGWSLRSFFASISAQSWSVGKFCVERWTWRRPAAAAASAASAAGAAVGGRRAEKSDMFGRDLCLKLASTIGLCLSVWLHSWVNPVLRTTSSTFTRSVLQQKLSFNWQATVQMFF